jgi:hypothetical protein
MQAHESVWLHHLLRIKANMLVSFRKHHQYSTMKLTSLATIAISAAVMAGVAIASEDLVITSMGLPRDSPGGNSCGQRADLGPHIQQGVQQASMVGTSTTISDISADLAAQSSHTQHAPIKTAVN